MEDDPKVLVMGEDVGKLGGVFRVTDGLQKDFGEDRVIDTPLAESGIIGTAIGLAMRGYRPVCEIQFDGFVYPAFDQIVSQLAKMHARSLGTVSAADRHPHPVRRRHRRGRAPQRVAPRPTSRTPPACKVVAVLEPGRRLLDDPAGDRQRRPGHLLRAQAPLLGEGRARRVADPRAARCRCSAARSCARARDVTLAAYGPMVKTCLEAATAAAEEGTSLEVVDLRSLSPLDMPTRARVGRARPAGSSSCTRRRCSSASAPRSRPGSPSSCFYSLEAPVLRVGGFDTPYPPSRLEEDYLPDLDRVLDAVDRSLAY